MKLKIKFDINQNNCYISLPNNFLKDQNIDLDYSANKICITIRLRSLETNNSKKIYLGNIIICIYLLRKYINKDTLDSLVKKIIQLK